MKALLIIDMQKASFSQCRRFDKDKVIERINGLSETFRKKSLPVVFIQHSGTEADGHKAHSEGWEILDELTQAQSDEIVQKTNCDSFYKTPLETFLKNNGVHEILISGCATDFCVDTTIRSAISKDFSITIPQGCHTTADRPHIEAQTVIKHHESIWADLITPNSKIRVQAYAETIKELLC